MSAQAKVYILIKNYELYINCYVGILYRRSQQDGESPQVPEENLQTAGGRRTIFTYQDRISSIMSYSQRDYESGKVDQPIPNPSLPTPDPLINQDTQNTYELNPSTTLFPNTPNPQTQPNSPQPHQHVRPQQPPPSSSKKTTRFT